MNKLEATQRSAFLEIPTESKTSVSQFQAPRRLTHDKARLGRNDFTVKTEDFRLTQSGFDSIMIKFTKIWERLLRLMV
jgi:hypothetical protein